ncbi:HTH-like domain-containing protein [Dyadobacter bucti]|uniref:HTH-like domain-containing protein n=1 Tax=Dyadobacter bucti TaxID=2572203 RepID=UPI004042BFB7
MYLVDVKSNQNKQGNENSLAPFYVHLLKEPHNAPRGGQVVNIHLFGIDHAEDISAVGITDVIEAAGIASSLRVELNKGVNLSKFVQRRK